MFAKRGGAGEVTPGKNLTPVILYWACASVFEGIIWLGVVVGKD